MVAIDLNRLDLAHKIEASLIEEAKVEVEPKRKKRKIEKLTGGEGPVNPFRMMLNQLRVLLQVITVKVLQLKIMGTHI